MIEVWTQGKKGKEKIVLRSSRFDERCTEMIFVQKKLAVKLFITLKINVHFFGH